MRSRGPLAWLICLLGASAATAAAQEDFVARLADALVADLGATAYEERERASELLRRIGEPAVPALRRTVQSDSEEARVRADQLLKDYELGIRPHWPSEAILQVRHYSQVLGDKRTAVMSDLCAELRDDAIPFLLVRGGKGGSRERADCLRCVTVDLGGMETARRIIQHVSEPEDEFPAHALTWAWFKLGFPLQAALVQARASVRFPERDAAAEAAVSEILGKLDDEHGATGTVEKARQLQALHPTDARFIYLEAEALRLQGKAEQAESVRRKVPPLNPGDEAAHAVAADMLEGMGRAEWAADEWQAVRSTAPDHTAFDIYAALRLCRIHFRAGRYALAAQAVGDAADALRQARAAGDELGLVSGAAGAMEMLQRVFQDKAARHPQGQGPFVSATLEAAELTAEAAAFVLDEDGIDQLDRFQEGLFLVKNSVNLRVRPPGMSLLSVHPTLLRYDTAQKSLQVLFKDVPCSDPVPFDPGEEPVPVVIYSYDQAYFYVVQPKVSQPHQIAAFDKDYLARFRFGPKLGAYRDVQIWIDDLPYLRDELERGIYYDRLPEAPVSIVVEGTSSEGARHRLTFRVTLAEPEIAPRKPEQEGEEEPNIEDVLRRPPQVM